MSARKNIFLTGATGFLGSHLMHRLLQEGHHVAALARSSKNSPASDRVRQVLMDVGDAPVTNLETYEGDISLPGLGLHEDASRLLASRTDEVWHCAASLSFQQEDRDKIFTMNVDGTRNVLEWVKRTKGRRLQHVSTAYIAGKRAGVVLEDEVDMGQAFKNAYEESKCRAELLIAAAEQSGAIRSSVYRPSIVIGDSRTGRVTHFHGVYAFIRAMWTALGRLRRRMSKPGSIHLPLRVLGSENTTLNFVPIDYVVNGMIEIARHDSSAGGTYHLTNPVPTENGVWLPHICRILDVEGIHMVGEDSFRKTPMNKLEALFQKQMAFYYQYLQGEPLFDCRRTQEALRNAGTECPRVTAEFIERMAGWYVQFLNQKVVL